WNTSYTAPSDTPPNVWTTTYNPPAGSRCKSVTDPNPVPKANGVLSLLANLAVLSSTKSVRAGESNRKPVRMPLRLKSNNCPARLPTTRSWAYVAPSVVAVGNARAVGGTGIFQLNSGSLYWEPGKLSIRARASAGVSASRVNGHRSCWVAGN